MRKFWYAALAVAALAGAPLAADAQAKKDSVALGIVLEPPVLDPTVNPAAAIGEVVHYNLFETLTKIHENGTVGPLLADSWTPSADGKTWTFKLKSGVKFHDGSPFSSADVKSSFTRYGAEGSTNKNKATFSNMEKIETPDAQTVVITLKATDAYFPFRIGENTAVITSEKTAAENSTKPVGTGPFKFESWTKGSTITLAKADTYRDPAAIKLNKLTFKVIADPAAAVAALLAGDVDAFPTMGAYETIDQFKKDGRFTVTVGSTEGETLLSINNKRKPFDDVRVRRAVSYALDRQGIIDGAMSGFGIPIGSHFPPHNPAYVDLTKVYEYNPDKAKALLKEANAVGTEVTLRLPPPPYARRGGEIIATLLTDVGFKVKIENLEWAAWLDQVFKNRNFDMTIISHVEPNDINIYSTKVKPGYYFNYENPKFEDLIAKAEATLDDNARKPLLQEAQKILAEDAVNGFLFVLPKVAVYKKGLKGLWQNAPIFVNDMTAVYWE